MRKGRIGKGLLINAAFPMERWYYFVAICILLFSVLIFLCRFEKRKPQAREVVVLAVMTSLAILGRLILFMTPQIKPCAAIIIITGIMLGKEAGFLCGALTAFVSDFFFGQGPWTIWQMFAFGMIGLLSAVIFSGKENLLREKKWLLCLYGFFAAFLGYGFIMDFSTVLMYTDSPKISALIATFITGLGFNLIHGFSTAVFLWFLANPFFRKLDRIKTKYGMYIKDVKKKTGK